MFLQCFYCVTYFNAQTPLTAITSNHALFDDFNSTGPFSYQVVQTLSQVLIDPFLLRCLHLSLRPAVHTNSHSLMRVCILLGPMEPSPWGTFPWSGNPPFPPFLITPLPKTGLHHLYLRGLPPNVLCKAGGDQNLMLWLPTPSVTLFGLPMEMYS